MRSFKALLKRAGLPVDTRLYDLRHTCATLLLNANVHPKYVQELLGHASISQTLDTYSHVLQGMDGGIGGAMDEALGSSLRLLCFPGICRHFPSEPPRTRTWNLEIKSLLLCQLS